MKKRPLCFLCMVLIVMNLLFLTSGDLLKSPDAFSQEEQTQDSDSIVYGEIYQCKLLNEYLILYLKQTVLSAKSTNSKKDQKLNRVRITCGEDTADLYPGDKICVTGQLKMLQGAANPGQFDSKKYYEGKKIDYTMWEPEIQLLERPRFSISRALYKVRQYCSGVISDCTDEETGILMRGIVLGDKSGISQETKELYQTGGISHILAISAMHLTILGNGFYALLKKMRLPVGLAGGLTGIFLTVYGVLTGASVATVRALIMFLLNIGGRLSGRTSDPPTSLALAAVLLLSGNPAVLGDSGFLLSFSAMVSFSVFKENRKLGSSILLYFFMAPVILWFFYEIPLYSVWINLLVVPTISIVLISGAAACLLGAISYHAGLAASLPGHFLLRIYQLLCRLAGEMPYSRLVLGRPSVAGVILYYGLMLFTLWLFRRYRLSWKRFFILLLMIPAWILLNFHPQKDLKIAALDVGQGDCIVIQSPAGKSYMVDGGSTTENRIGEYRIWPYLKYYGISKLEGIFVTHPDEDHINGILELLELIKEDRISLKVEQLIIPKWKNRSAFAEIIALAKVAEIPVYEMGAGESFADGEVHFACLYPDGGDYTKDYNAGSLVLEIAYGEFCGLLMGDLEGECEEKMLEAFGEVDWLKVAHHGSKYSTCEKFLSVVDPKISVISCGAYNFYGHPHEELLERLEKAGTDIYATKDFGAIWVITDGEKIDLRTFRKYTYL